MARYTGQDDIAVGTAVSGRGRAELDDVVGLFVKDNYTQMLNDLNELFTAMQEGLQSGADKFTGAAQDYADQEEAVKQLLNGLQIELDNQ
ncbi:ESX-1 secretion-associated protein [Saccharothrix sp. MB29]|nr:ESX-1 secretion-associated protein [Saccharothrix sp. MB29]